MIWKAILYWVAFFIYYFEIGGSGFGVIKETWAYALPGTGSYILDWAHVLTHRDHLPQIGRMVLRIRLIFRRLGAWSYVSGSSSADWAHVLTSRVHLPHFGRMCLRIGLISPPIKAKKIRLHYTKGSLLNHSSSFQTISPYSSS